MANKVFAFFVVCMVLLATVKVQAESDKDSQIYVSCFNSCEAECKAAGGGHTFCEMKCDEDCSDKELEGKILYHY